MFLEFQDYSIFILIVFILFGLSSLVQLIYYWGVFSKLAFYKRKKIACKTQAVSVVICAKNEYYNLSENLPLILKQDYPDFEVVLVNDFSDDDTEELLDDMKRKFSNLKVINLNRNLNFFKGKKFPLSIGIKSAKNEILLLTDADCKPASSQWISSMASNYTSHTEVVLGYGPYNKLGGLLNMLIRYDTFIIAMQYFSYAIMGKPYMGVGRNLSYRKSTFFKNKGFTSHYNIPSGDDDLFIKQVSSKSNTKIELSENSYMFSEPKHTFDDWFRQKQRHLSTSKAYSTLFKLLLGGYNISQLLFYITLVLLIINNTLLIATMPIFIITFLSRIFIQKKAASRLGENQLLLFSLFGDILYVILLPILTLMSLIRKSGSWK